MCVLGSWEWLVIFFSQLYAVSHYQETSKLNLIFCKLKLISGWCSSTHILWFCPKDEYYQCSKSFGSYPLWCHQIGGCIPLQMRGNLGVLLSIGNNSIPLWTGLHPAPLERAVNYGTYSVHQELSFWFSWLVGRVFIANPFLYKKSVLFQTIQFSMSTRFNC